jgi:predicted acylesterase/phospholipase RssA
MPAGLIGATITCPDAGAAAALYKAALGYVRLDSGHITPAQAQLWQAPALAGATCVRLVPQGRTAPWLRFISQPGTPTAAFTTSGWAALELTVQDCAQAVSRLAAHGFTIAGPAADLDFAEGALCAGQLHGPHGEMLYLTQVRHQVPGYDLPQAERAIDRLPGKQARPRVDLVLLQEEPPYRGTARWLADREVVRHHHVRLHSTADRARAGRMLTGRDVTLALGGGGARGFAHIGVIRACQELGIPIDRICGTSMGSIVAGLYAMGMDWNAMTEHLRSHFLPKRRLSQYTFPILSIDTSRNYEKALRRLYGNTEIEDLPVNYFCVSCNLTTASVVIHRSGPLAKWIGASISVPGIAPPYVERGELLVDGGLLNNLPVDIAKADGAGMAIAVDVSPETEFRLPSSYSGRPQALEVLWSRITRKSRESQGFEHKPVHPTLGALLVRATTLTSVNQKDLLAKVADLYIKPPVDGFKLLDFDKLDSISEIGYTAGMSDLLGVVDWIKQSPSKNQP